MKISLQDGSNSKKEKAAIMLAAGATVADTAAAIEMDKDTVSQWRNVRDFETLVAQEQQAVMAVAHGKVIQLSQKAVATLERLLNSPNERVALSAALGILGNSKLAAEAEAKKRDPFNLLG